MDSQADAWHRSLVHITRNQLDDGTAQTAGMQRLEAVSARLTQSEQIWMGETHVSSGVRSADHHHGASETAIYVLQGHPVFVFLEDGLERRIVTSPGDYVYVPPFVAHREENPGEEPAVVVLARTTQEAIVINLEGLSDPSGRSAENL